MDYESVYSLEYIQTFVFGVQEKYATFSNTGKCAPNSFANIYELIDKRA